MQLRMKSEGSVAMSCVESGAVPTCMSVKTAEETMMAMKLLFVSDFLRMFWMRPR